MHKKILAASLASALLLAPINAFADKSGFCQSGTITVCNMPISMATNPVGYSAILTVPGPYVHQSFTVQCVPMHHAPPVYNIVSSAVSCILRKCDAGDVKICGYPVTVPAGTVAGGQVQIDVPAAYLNVSHASSPPSFTTTCVDHGDTQDYQVTNSSAVSCNDFACQTAALPVCGTQVTLQGGAALGDVFDVTVPPPFVADHFKVQCLGSNGNAPVYEMTDSRAISCKRPQ